MKTGCKCPTEEEIERLYVIKCSYPGLWRLINNVPVPRRPKFELQDVSNSNDDLIEMG